MSTAPEALGRKSIWPWLVLLGCVGCYAIPVGMIGNLAGLYVAPVMTEFGWNQTDTTMYRVIQPLVGAVFTPIAGRMFAKFSPRLLLTISSVLFGVASVGTAFATALWQWNLYGVVYGITAAFFMYMAVPVLVNRWFVKNVGLALGLTAAILSILAAVMSPIAQALITDHSWQYSRLVICSIATVLSVVMTVVFVRDDPAQLGVRKLGESEATATGAALGSDAPASSDQGATKAQALSNPGLYLVILIAAIVVMTAAFFQQIPAYTSKNPLLGPAVGALSVTIVMIGGTVGKLLLGWLADRIGVQLTSVIAMVGGGVGIFLTFIATAPWLVYVGMAVFGLGYAGLTVIVPMLVRTSFGSRNYAEIFSWVSTGIFLATALSFIVYGRIVDLTGSFSGAFILVIVMYVIAALLIYPAVGLSRKSWNQAEPDVATTDSETRAS